MGTSCLKVCRVAAALLIVASAEASHAAASEPDGRDLTPTARDLSDRGLGQYQRGELDAAIESFMGAFALSNNPGLLFNVAQAFRLKRDCARAKEYYRRYLDAVPESALRPSVERRLDEMESCLRASTTAANVPAGAPADGAPIARSTEAVRAVASPPELSPSPAHAASQGTHGIVWTLRGSGAALLASSIAFGALAWDARRDAEATSLQRPAAEANDRYQVDAALAWTFAISGLACSVISYLVGRR